MYALVLALPRGRPVFGVALAALPDHGAQVHLLSLPWTMLSGRWRPLEGWLLRLPPQSFLHDRAASFILMMRRYASR